MDQCALLGAPALTSGGAATLLRIETVEQMKQELVDWVETHLCFLRSSLSERTIERS
jgi:hypothetical protein